MESSGCPVFKELMSKKFLEWWRWKTLGKRVWLSQWWMENCQQTYLESMEKDIKIILEIENKEQEVINKLTDVGTIIQALQSSLWGIWQWAHLPEGGPTTCEKLYFLFQGFDALLIPLITFLITYLIHVFLSFKSWKAQKWLLPCLNCLAPHRVDTQ